MMQVHFDQIKANLAEIQPKNHQNVQETPFSQKAPGVNGLISSMSHAVVSVLNFL